MRKKGKRRRVRKQKVRLYEPVPEVMDIKTLAGYLRMGKSKIYALIRQKKIPASRIGRQYRFSKSVIDKWLSEKLITRREEPQMSFFEENK